MPGKNSIRSRLSEVPHLKMKRPGFIATLIALLFSLATDALAHTAGSANVPDSIGLQRTAVVLLDALGDGKLMDPALIRQAVFDGTYSISNFIRESSYGQAWLEGQVYDWMDMRPTGQKCTLSHEELFKFLSQKMRLGQYDRFLVLYHNDPTACTVALGGLGQSTFGKIH